MKETPPQPTLSYSAWRALTPAERAAIGGCEDCAFATRRITLCAAHAQAHATRTRRPAGFGSGESRSRSGSDG
jgi:hypothetical protein